MAKGFLSKRFVFYLSLLGMALTVLSSYFAHSAGYIQVGAERISQSASWWLAPPNELAVAQDQVSGVIAIPGRGALADVFPGFGFLSIGDDSGQVFAFNLGNGYLNQMKAHRIPQWTLDLDLEAIAVIPPTGELVVSLEGRDTAVSVIKFNGMGLGLDEKIALELPPGYRRFSNVGPEGLAYDGKGDYLIVAWEGAVDAQPRLRPYLSIYKFFLGESEVTSYKFLKHIELPTRFKSASGLHYSPELETLLLLDRNADTLYAIASFITGDLARLPNPQYCFKNVLRMEFSGITDPNGREFRYYSFEGVTLDENGTLYLVTDPWRSKDYSTYRPLNEEPDDFYKSFVPQMFEFKGFGSALTWALFSYYFPEDD